MSAPVKKKKPWPPVLAVTLIASQYVSAHVSGWLNEVGSFDFMYFDSLFDYFALHPFDLFSFHPGAYAMCYATGFCVYFYWLFSREPPKAEMKGEEHGSNDFMTSEEIREFSAQRSTPVMPYSRDIRQAGVYPKGGGKR